MLIKDQNRYYASGSNHFVVAKWVRGNAPAPSISSSQRRFIPEAVIDIFTTFPKFSLFTKPSRSVEDPILRANAFCTALET
jgi:hypothetical protein